MRKKKKKKKVRIPIRSFGGKVRDLRDLTGVLLRQKILQFSLTLFLRLSFNVVKETTNNMHTVSHKHTAIKTAGSGAF